MQIQVATLCDAAADYGGKLSVMGAFDTIAGGNTPVVHPQCALALRVCFEVQDVGLQTFHIGLIDGDGNPVMPPIQPEPKIQVQMPSPDTIFVSHNLIINMQGLKFDKAGHFSFDIRVGDEKEMLCRIPIRVLLLDENGRPLPMD